MLPSPRFPHRLLAGLLAAAASTLAAAQAVPHSLQASPGIYKVIAENAQYRVIEVTWQPGQRDAVHSHPASAVYYPMDCTLRSYGGDGTVLGQRSIPAGNAIVQAPIAAHSVENIGSAVCRVIMFEPR